MIKTDRDMEKELRIIANYSQQGHPMYNEDTWDDSCVIDNEKDLLDACKGWHKISAQSFNDYPFGGLFSFRNITFTKQVVITDDSGELFYGKKKDCDNPEYFEKVKNEFDEWLKNVKERLPKLRNARDLRLKEQSERRKLEELILKYGKI